MNKAVTAAVMTVALAVAACGGGTPSEDDPGSVQGADLMDLAECGGVTFEPDMLRDAPGLESLPEGPANAVSPGGFEPAFDASLDWRVVQREDEHVGLLRSLDEPFDNGPGDVREYFSMSLMQMKDTAGVPDGGWMRTSMGPCSPRLVPPEGIGSATLQLAAQPTPDATTLDLLVTEGACASGQPAEGRIELLDLTETDTQVEIRVGVQPLPGAQTCPGNPATPYSVELDSPVGQRSVINAGVIPPRPIPVAEAPETDGPVDLTPTDATVSSALGYQPPDSYVLELDTICFCEGEGFMRVTVEGGEVTAREALDADGQPVGDAPPELAPSLNELLQRLQAAWHESAEDVRVLHVAPDTGALRSVTFAPGPTGEGEITYAVNHIRTDG